MICKIAVVGNSGGGKTTLSRRLAKLHDLPLTHVDSIQFLPGLKMRPFKESIAQLNEIQNQPIWLIDGYGPLDLIEKRFLLADRIVFIDFPLWRHYYWNFKRLVKSLYAQRSELPPNSQELNWTHITKLYKTMRSMHLQMRPELLKIFSQDHLKNKMIYIRNPKQWRAFYKAGVENLSIY